MTQSDPHIDLLDIQAVGRGKALALLLEKANGVLFAAGTPSGVMQGMTSPSSSLMALSKAGRSIVPAMQVVPRPRSTA